MQTRSVSYQKKLEVRGGTGREILDVETAVRKVKEMAEVRADRTYKNGRKRKKFDQTVEMVMHLGIDARQAEQAMRGALSLPKGIGKSRRVVAFCDEATAEQARSVGAVDAGADALIKRIEGGWAEFDVAVAHPSMMGKVGKLGRVLGPQGKMPSPKAGTVTPEVVKAVQDFSGGRVEYRNDAGGNVHIPIGVASFSVEDLKENAETALRTIARSKPASAKGQFFKRVCISATHTPSVSVAPPV